MSYFWNNLLHAMAALGCSPKVKRSLGLAFGAHVLHDFSIKMFFIEYCFNGQNFNVIPLFLPKMVTTKTVNHPKPSKAI